MNRVPLVEDQRMPRENMERILADSGKYETEDYTVYVTNVAG